MKAIAWKKITIYSYDYSSVISQLTNYHKALHMSECELLALKRSSIGFVKI